MHKIVKSRARFLRALIKASNELQSLGSFRDSNSQCVSLNNIINLIGKDQHFAAIGSDISKVSFARNPKDKLDEEKRIETSFGRYIRRQLHIHDYEFADHWLDALSQSVLRNLVSSTELENRIKLLTGDAITEHYENSPSHSCMTGDESNKTQLYALNPNNVSLVVMDGFVRALLWTCDDGAKVLDRIYPSGCKEVSLLSEWAERNKFIRRNNADGAGRDRKEELSDGSIRSITLMYKDNFPYMDTFKFTNEGTDNLVVVSNCSSHFVNGNYFVATDTEGLLPWDNSHCKACGRLIDEDEACQYNNEIYCSDCYSENFSECYHCGDSYDNNEISVINSYERSVCDRCLSKYYTLCENCNEYIMNDDIVRIKDKSCVCKDCTDNYFVCCDHCDEYVSENSFINVDGNSICEDCIDRHYYKCEDCGEYVINKEAIEKDSCFYCEDCGAKEQ